MTTLARFYCCALLVFALFDESKADTRYDVVPAPAWVVPAELPARKSPDSDSHHGGADYILVDHQIRLGAVEFHYSRFVTRLTNVSGIEDNSQITINFDPKVERLHVHSFLIWRGSQSIDQLRNGRVRVIQRESNLEDQLVDGELTFHLVMTDVRVGDVVDYSYSLERRDIEWGNRHFGRLLTQWNDPVGLLRIRFAYPLGSPLKTLTLPAEVPTTSTASGLNIAEWSKANVAAVSHEKDTPSWFQQYGAVEYSQFSSWGQIVEAAIPLYFVAAPPSSELKRLTARFAAAGSSDALRVIQVMKFVQEEIRYTGIEEGEGAFRPTPPNEVLSRRYGDCKDKTLLAVTLLKSIGIEAAPALVSTHWKGEVANHLPSPGLMNHVVVRTVVDGRIYWFDATSTGQGGRLASFTQASFGKALVIAPGVTSLEPMLAVGLAKSLAKTQAIFDLRAGLFAESGLNVTTTYLGAEADRMRRRLRSQGAEELAQKYLHYYKGQYAGTRSIGALQIADKIEVNELTVAESYRIKDGFETDKQGRQRLYVNADTITDSLAAPALPERTTPLAVDFPEYLSTQIQLLLPTAWDVDTENIKIDTPIFHYASSVGYRDKVITLDYEYTALKDHVVVTELPAHIKQLKQARDDTYFHISRTAGTKTEQVQQDSFWAVKLVGLLAILFLTLRFSRYALTVRALLAMSLNHVEASDCNESEVPERERIFLQSLDEQLIQQRFESVGFVRYSSLYTRYDKSEYLRVLHQADPPVTAYVSRDYGPEYGAYVRAWFETDLADGTQLQTTDGAFDGKVGSPKVLSEAIRGASVSQLISRHGERLKALEDSRGVAAIGVRAEGFAARVVAAYAAVRAEWLLNGWIRATADLRLDRVTMKGARRLAQSAIRTHSVRAAGPALLMSSKAASSTDHAMRAEADFVAASHLAKVARSAPGVNWPLIVYCALLMVVPLGVIAAVSGVFEATMMLTALLFHEAAHLWVLGKRRAAPGLLFFLPFTGLVPTESSEPGIMHRVSVMLAGPMLGLMIGVVLLLADAIWPSHYFRNAASIFIGFNGLLLIPYPGTDGFRIVTLATAPGSLMRPLALLLGVVALLAIGIQLKSQFLNTIGFMLAVWFVVQLPTFKLTRRVVRQIPSGSDWDSAVRAAFVAMTAPNFWRWGASIRQMRAISIANDLARPVNSRREQMLTMVAYACCALLAICAALRASL
jgi:transglutaminase-like putative cysteine protease